MFVLEETPENRAHSSSGKCTEAADIQRFGRANCKTLILFLKAEVIDAQYAHLFKCWTKTTYIVMASEDSVISEGPT